MFKGEYNHTIDPKNRLIIPAKFREQLGEAFVITRGLENGCLYIYGAEEWNRFEENLRALPSNENSRKLVRYFTANAADVEVDKQGRILIPTTLKEAAGLEKDVVLAGVLTRIEIWAKDKWDQNVYDDMNDIAEQMAELGLSI